MSAAADWLISVRTLVEKDAPKEIVLSEIDQALRDVQP